MNLLDTIKRLRDLEKKATRGPWERGIKPRTLEPNKEVLSTARGIICNTIQTRYWDGHEVKTQAHDDALYIAESRNALPQLLTALKDAVELIDDIHGQALADSDIRTGIMKGPKTTEEWEKLFHFERKERRDECFEFLKKHGIGGDDE